MRFRPFWSGALALCALVATGCSAATTPDAAPSTGPPPPARPTPSPSATATPQPMAAVVHGEGIPLARFERELARFEAAQAELGIELAALGDYRSQVLDLLIDRVLLALGAKGRGFEVTEDNLDQRLASIAEAQGGQAAMGAWLAANGYTLEEFKADLAQEMMAANMVGSIIDELPDAVEQVHARHILVATQDEAEALLERVRSGEDFAELASLYSRDTQTRLAGGDLGWFIRGQLTMPEVEEAAFGLEPGELSDVVQSDLGFHLVLPLEREQRPVYGEIRTRYREAAVEAWLDASRESAEIEIYIQP